MAHRSTQPRAGTQPLQPRPAPCPRGALRWCRTHARSPPPVRAAAAPSAQERQTEPGLFFLPGVTSPELLKAYWRQSCRPRLDALLRKASALPPKPALLPVVDQLLFEFKQISIPAQHCAQRHSDPQWRVAADDVANDCRKYEEYLFSQRGLVAKIATIERTYEAHSSNSINDKTGESTGGSQQSQGLRGAAPPAWATQPLCDASGRRATPAELLRLARLARRTFERQYARVEDGLAHLVAPHAAVGVAGAAYNDARALTAREREVAARVRAVVSDVRLAPTLALADLPWPATHTAPPTTNTTTGTTSATHTTPPARSHTTTTSKDSPPHTHTHDDNNRHNESTPADTNDTDTDSPQPPWEGDALIQRLVTRTSRRGSGYTARVYATSMQSQSDDDAPVNGAGGVSASREGLASTQSDSEDSALVTSDRNGSTTSTDNGAMGEGCGVERGWARWDDAVVLDRHATQLLLRLHPCGVVRRAVLEQGVLRRVGVMTQLVNQQAQIRRVLARLEDQPSYAHSVQGPGVCAVGGPEDIVRALVDIADTVAGPAQKQLARLTEMSDGPIELCDLAYLEERLREREGVTMPLLCEPLTLESIMQGLSGLLEQSMCLRLQPLALTGAQQWREGVLAYVLLDTAPQPDAAPQSTDSRMHIQPATPPEQHTGTQAPSSTAISQRHSVSHRTPSTHTAPTHATSTHTTPTHTRPVGIIYLDPGGGYGTRQLRFTRTWDTDNMSTQGTRTHTQPTSHTESRATTLTSDNGQAVDMSFGSQALHGLPAVSVGLQQAWVQPKAGDNGQVAGGLWELMHELGHALHLLLSSHGKMFKLFGGLHLPLDLLEVPSQFMEGLLLRPECVQQICGCDAAIARRMALVFKAQHRSALAFQEQILVALSDQLLGMTEPESDATAQQVYETVFTQQGSVPLVPLKRLSALPVAAHLPCMYWAYAVALVTAACVWKRAVDGNAPDGRPVNQAWGMEARRVLLSMGADQEPATVMSALLEGLHDDEGEETGAEDWTAGALWTGEQ